MAERALQSLEPVRLRDEDGRRDDHRRRGRRVHPNGWLGRPLRALRRGTRVLRRIRAGAGADLFIRGPASLPRPLPADRLASLAALLAAGADPNFRIEDYNLFQLPNLSPLNSAAAGDDAEAIALLLRHGARTDLVEKGYLRPYGPALVLCSQPQACEALLAAGADLRYADEGGDTLVHIAARRLVDGAPALAKLRWLAHRNFPMDARNREGRTPRKLALSALDTAKHNGLGQSVVAAAEEALALLADDPRR
ncbi:MAG: hypothetical protein AB7P21_21080 [Lautropia sp.]